MSPALASWPALGTTAEVAVADPAALPAARRAVERELALIDAACSRFREDSELSALNAAGGAPVRVGPVLMEALEAALRAARVSGGAVDPTIGAGVAAAGYDRDFAALPDDGPAVRPMPAPGWRSCASTARAGEAVLAPWARLDLGATAKALASDRCRGRRGPRGRRRRPRQPGRRRRRARPRPGRRLGDRRRRRPPRARRRPHRARARRRPRHVEHDAAPLAPRRARRVHHILDPRTGLPAAPIWRTVSVAAASCVAANTLSTAAIVWGEDAPIRLRAAACRRAWSARTARWSRPAAGLRTRATADGRLVSRPRHRRRHARAAHAHARARHRQRAPLGAARAPALRRRRPAPHARAARRRAARRPHRHERARQLRLDLPDRRPRPVRRLLSPVLARPRRAVARPAGGADRHQPAARADRPARVARGPLGRLRVLADRRRCTASAWAPTPRAGCCG